ncbi:hypothetical protein D3C81_1490090 [compost metagenome]
MVVAGDDQHAAVGRGAVGMAVLQGIAGAVDARALAVPVGEHALDGALGVGLDLLGAEHRGAAQFFVDRGEEFDLVVGQHALGLPQRLVDHTQRRATVAADEAGGVQATFAVDGALHQRQAHQRLGASEENLAAGGLEVVAQLVVAAQLHGAGAIGRMGHCCCPARCCSGVVLWGIVFPSGRSFLFLFFPVRR